MCLKRLVRTIVRSFYSREHSLIIDLLVSESLFFDAIITLLVFLLVFYKAALILGLLRYMCISHSML